MEKGRENEKERWGGDAFLSIREEIVEIQNLS